MDTAPLIFLIAGIVLMLSAVIFLIIDSSKRRKVYKEENPLFNETGKGQNFSTTIARYKQLTSRARATFLFRFVEELNAEDLTVIRKYLSKIK